MYFILQGANFPDSIGQLQGVKPGEVGSGGTGGGTVDPNATLTINPSPSDATVVLTATGYTQSGKSITVAKGTQVTYTVSKTGYTTKTGTIKVSYTQSMGVSLVSESGGSGGTDTPVNPPSSDFTAVPYTSQLSASGLSKTDGSILSSGTGYVNVYENLDFTKTYYASGYAPAATGSNAIVCYYKADGTFISAESGNDWGISSQKYEHRQLTIPADTAIIKLFGRTNSGEGCTLEIGLNYTLISHSEINEKSNLSETDGTLGTSSTGVVKTYNNIDVSKTYVADGFCPNATGTAAFVCYYNSSNTFISSQDGNDFGLSSKAASKVTLTVPSGTSIIKLFGQGGSSDPYLYTVE